MKRLRSAFQTTVVCWWIGAAVTGVASEPRAVGLLRGLEERSFDVNGVVRHAWVYIPAGAKTNATPVVFVFHGHGGTSRNAAQSFGLHREWPEAIAIYPQGLNTPGRLRDPEGQRPGWQVQSGAQGDRDLAFFDAALAWLRGNYQVDTNRVYATGHSNGGMFTYLLWETRGAVLAAVAPSGAVAGIRGAARLSPKPALHIAGRRDTLVKFEWQKVTMEMVRKLNGCKSEGKPWGEHSTLYESAGGTPLVTFIYPGGHGFPSAAPALIVKFFKKHPSR